MTLAREYILAIGSGRFLRPRISHFLRIVLLIRKVGASFRRSKQQSRGLRTGDESTFGLFEQAWTVIREHLHHFYHGCRKQFNALVTLNDRADGLCRLVEFLFVHQEAIFGGS